MIVLDASALLALINAEPGWEVVARDAASNDATISAVNYAEVLQKATRLGVPAEDVDGELEALGMTVSHFGRPRCSSRCFVLSAPFGPELR